MATIQPTHVWIARGVLQTTWAGLTTASDVGAPLDAPTLPDKTVEVRGTFNAGTLDLVGAMTATATGTVLNDSRGEGNGLTFSAADMRTVLENPRYLWPYVPTATTGTSLTVTVLSQSMKR